MAARDRWLVEDYDGSRAEVDTAGVWQIVVGQYLTVYGEAYLQREIRDGDVFHVLRHPETLTFVRRQPVSACTVRINGQPCARLDPHPDEDVHYTAPWGG